jgi:stage V sporulation protein R
MNLDELESWDEKITEFVKNFKLNVYPQEFEICDHFEMLGYMAYSGMPSRYPHWSFGKSYEREKTMYDYGAGGLPYEMVINSNPCLAYLMRDNTDLLQILTIAHVYGHNDFFANNFTFTTSLDAKYTLEMFKNNARRIRKYTEDPSIGLDNVEPLLDSAHALSLQRSRNLAITKLSQDEQRRRRWEAAQLPEDRWEEINPKREYVQPDLSRFPLEPDSDILQFIGENNPFLASWQKDILLIVNAESSYFVPQIETKIMNEGWASYWHHKILNAMKLPNGLHLEFIVRHNQVLRPHPGGLNPYHLGFVLWHDIERRFNEEAGYKPKKSFEEDPFGDNDSPGRQKIFEIRRSDRDASFLRRFLTEELMRELDLFQHEKRGKDRVISKVADSESWQDIKSTLISQVGMGSIPVIQVYDADFQGKRVLYLKHEHDGRDLQLEYAERTLAHVRKLWGRNVYLESILNGKKSLFKLDGDTLKVDKL